MFKIGIGLLFISLFSILSCKNKPKEVAVAFTVVDLKKHTEIDAKSNYENNKDTVIDVNRLDFLSKKVSLPYGKKEIIDYNFPDHWYCGGGYLNGSLQEEGYPVKDSIRYANAYFAITKFDRENQLAFYKETQTFSLGGSISKINEMLLKSNDQRISSLKPSVSAFIKLPNVYGNMVFGVVTQENNIFYNPIYLIVKNGVVQDVLSTYEYSRIETLVNKSCYIDENYIWHIRSFENVDGFEVETIRYERYIISKEGCFIKI